MQIVSEPISFLVMREEAQAVLSSQTFARSPSLMRLLNYLCEKYERGEADQLKEYTIAVEAYGRPEGLSHKETSVVRVEIKRLREKLRQFYETEGAARPWQITIPIGQYALVLVSRNESNDLTSDTATTMTVTTIEEPAIAESVNHRSWWRWTALAAGALVVVVLLVAALRSRQAARGTSASNAAVLTASNAATNAFTTVAPPSEPRAIRLLAGSQVNKFLDHAGKLWLGDQFFVGGAAHKTSVAFVERTLDPEIYQTSRQGDFFYHIPLAPGTYELRLHFMENFYGPDTAGGGGETSRLFAVKANEEFLLKPMDVYASAGGNCTAEVQVFKNIRPAADGKLHLQFYSWTHGKALLQAIEVLPAPPDAINPIYLTTHDKPILTADEREWSPDAYFKGGRVIARTGTVTGTTMPELFQSERFGNFSYALPVAPGRYTVRLHFAERFFGPNRPGATEKGPGSRVFHVFCNGEALLKNFDIYREAGGQDRALMRQFKGLQPNAQGKLLLEFKPVVNYALINAIEVTDEASPKK
jgi:hypothetical protein